MKRSRVGALLSRSSVAGGCEEAALHRWEDEEDASFAASLSDLRAALAVLRRDWPHNARALPQKELRKPPQALRTLTPLVCPLPVLLQTQVRGLLSREGGWARELLQLQRSGAVRMCKTPLSGSDATAIVFVDDLLGYASEWGIHRGGIALTAVEMLRHLIEACSSNLCVESADLQSCFARASVVRSSVVGAESGAGAADARKYAPRPVASSRGSRGDSGGGSMRTAGGSRAAVPVAVAASAASAAIASLGGAQAVVDALLHEGFLLRALGGVAERFYFGVPSSGRLWQYVEAGRSELQQRIRRRAHAEMPRKDAEELRLVSTPLPTIFHIRDAIGASILDVAAAGAAGTSAGSTLLRLHT